MGSLADPPGATSAEEASLLWILADSNLPTGGFVASSGLESFWAHGFLHLQGDAPPAALAGDGDRRDTSTSGLSVKRPTTGNQLGEKTLEFLRHALGSYAAGCVGFMVDVRDVVCELMEERLHDGEEERDEKRVEDCVEKLLVLDQAYHSLVLNHVLRRASKAQGMALLQIWSKSFTPSVTGIEVPPERQDGTRRAEKVLEKYKLLIRRSHAVSSSSSTPQAPGHLPLLFSLFLSSLSPRLSLYSIVHLHLFLQARAMISSAIRLNLVGPYQGHAWLVGRVREMVREVLQEMGLNESSTDAEQRRSTTGLVSISRSTSTSTSMSTLAAEAEAASAATPLKKRKLSLSSSSSVTASVTAAPSPQRRPPNDFDSSWTWDDEGSWSSSSSPSLELDDNIIPSRSQSIKAKAPTTTWPLGEIIQARHDVLFSRLFNS